MKFKVGDVVELFRVLDPELSHNIGLRFDVTGASYFDPYRSTPNGVCGMDVTPLRSISNGRADALATCCLRLVRPPSWDKWLYDTSGVKDERPVNAEQVDGIWHVYPAGDSPLTRWVP